MYNEKIEIEETSKEDLENIMELWNNGEVMSFVGFPQGLGITYEDLERWLKGVNKSIYRKHYSIYTDDLGYCGETYYEIDRANDLGILDIKVFPKAQGKGIAEYSLRYVIGQVFQKNLASKAIVDPDPENKAAWKLYEKLGFVSKPRPDYLEPGLTYLEITPEIYANWGVVAEDEDIILGVLRPSDIEDDIKWNTIEVEWQLWDAPWEFENTDFKDWDEYRERRLEKLKIPRPVNRLHSSLEIYLNDEKETHIGGLNHYNIDENYEYTKEKGRCTLGIGIYDSNFWGKGLGTKAFRLYIKYLFDYGLSELYTQTWSGNERMVRVAEKLGFKEVNREVGFREVRGEIYDGLTFCLKIEDYNY